MELESQLKKWVQNHPVSMIMAIKTSLHPQSPDAYPEGYCYNFRQEE